MHVKYKGIVNRGSNQQQREGRVLVALGNPASLQLLSSDLRIACLSYNYNNMATAIYNVVVKSHRSHDSNHGHVMVNRKVS